MEMDDQSESVSPNKSPDTLNRNPSEEEEEKTKGQDEVQEQTKKKRKKKLGYGKSKKSTSKGLQILPSSLSDFSWIENTQANKILLEQEK